MSTHAPATKPKRRTRRTLDASADAPSADSGVESADGASVDPRARLQAGMAQAVSEKGYAATTIADVVRHAHVSKRTFYEHYVDKEACFLAAYSAASNDLMARVAAAAGSSAERPIELAVHTYFAALDERRAWARTFFSEIHAVGPAALALRRKIHLKFASLLRVTVEGARARGVKVAPLSADMALAVVGGVNELVLCALERNQRGSLSALAETAIELLRAVSTPGRGAAR